MENTKNKKQKMKLKIFIDFATYYNDSIRLVEVDIPFVPRIGEWLCAEEFLSEENHEHYEKIRRDDGSFYVRNIQHYFNREKNIQRVFLAVVRGFQTHRASAK